MGLVCEGPHHRPPCAGAHCSSSHTTQPMGTMLTNVWTRSALGGLCAAWQWGAAPLRRQLHQRQQHHSALTCLVALCVNGVMGPIDASGKGHVGNRLDVAVLWILQRARGGESRGRLYAVGSQPRGDSRAGCQPMQPNAVYLPFCDSTLCRQAGCWPGAACARLQAWCKRA
jgi:hypothetical protein